MCGPEDPLFTPLLPLARVPFQAKESVHKTPFWENLEILASTASIFTQILAHKPQIWKFSAHKPPNLEIFSSQASKFGNFPLTSPPFQRQMSVRKPHTLEIRAAHPYLKKSWVPPRGQAQSKKQKVLEQESKISLGNHCRFVVLTLLRFGYRYLAVLTVCLWARFSHCCFECFRTIKYLHVFVTFVMIMLVQVNSQMSEVSPSSLTMIRKSFQNYKGARYRLEMLSLCV